MLWDPKFYKNILVNWFYEKFGMGCVKNAIDDMRFEKAKTRLDYLVRNPGSIRDYLNDTRRNHGHELSVLEGMAAGNKGSFNAYPELAEGKNSVIFPAMNAGTIDNLLADPRMGAELVSSCAVNEKGRVLVGRVQGDSFETYSLLAKPALLVMEYCNCNNPSQRLTALDAGSSSLIIPEKK